MLLLCSLSTLAALGTLLVIAAVIAVLVIVLVPLALVLVVLLPLLSVLREVIKCIKIHASTIQYNKILKLTGTSGKKNGTIILLNLLWLLQLKRNMKMSESVNCGVTLRSAHVASDFFIRFCRIEHFNQLHGSVEL